MLEELMTKLNEGEGIDRLTRRSEMEIFKRWYQKFQERYEETTEGMMEEMKRNQQIEYDITDTTNSRHITTEDIYDHPLADSEEDESH